MSMGLIRNYSSRVFVVWFIGIILILLLAGNAALTYFLFLRMQVHSIERRDVLAKLADTKRMIDGYGAQTKALFERLGEIKTELKVTNIKIEEANREIREVNNALDAQKVAMENISKAKNTLFKRVNSLEIAVDKLDGGDK
ncbi:MAG: hypothetical protein ABIG56_04025 [Candidatus Omnitrophota bacterium]